MQFWCLGSCAFPGKKFGSVKREPAKTIPTHGLIGNDDGGQDFDSHALEVRLAEFALRGLSQILAL
jgi:hypothetical protein